MQLRLHVVDQTGVDTAAVSGNFYLQLVVQNDRSFFASIRSTVPTPIVSTSVFNDSQPLFLSFSASVVQLVLCRESRIFGLEVLSACFS